MVSLCGRKGRVTEKGAQLHPGRLALTAMPQTLSLTSAQDRGCRVVPSAPHRHVLPPHPFPLRQLHPKRHFLSPHLAVRPAQCRQQRQRVQRSAPQTHSPPNERRVLSQLRPRCATVLPQLGQLFIHWVAINAASFVVLQGAARDSTRKGLQVKPLVLSREEYSALVPTFKPIKAVVPFGRRRDEPKARMVVKEHGSNAVRV